MLTPEQKTILDLLIGGSTYREIGEHIARPRFLVKQAVKESFQRLDSLSPDARGPELEAIYQFLLSRFPDHHVVKRAAQASSLHPERLLPPLRSQATSVVELSPVVEYSRPPKVDPNKIRINELARQLEIPSADIIDMLPELGVTEKKTHSSSVEKELAETIRRRVEDKKEKDESPQNNGEEYVGLALVEGRFRLIAMRPDGTYRYLDSSGSLNDLIFTISSETKALEHAIEELEELLNSRAAKEHDFQSFFENNPGFITTDDHIEARADVFLTREGAPTLKPDFMLKPLDPHRTSDLLELKLPSAQLYVLKARRERLSQAVMEARAQLHEYARYFDDAKQREKIQSTYGVFAYRPRMFVVIGRRGKISPVIRRNAELTADDITLRTYDDIVDRMKQRVKSMRSGPFGLV